MMLRSTRRCAVAPRPQVPPRLGEVTSFLDRFGSRPLQILLWKISPRPNGRSSMRAWSRGAATDPSARTLEERWTWLMAAHVVGQHQCRLHFDSHRRMLEPAHERGTGAKWRGSCCASACCRWAICWVRSRAATSAARRWASCRRGASPRRCSGGRLGDPGRAHPRAQQAGRLSLTRRGQVLADDAGQLEHGHLRLAEHRAQLVVGVDRNACSWRPAGPWP